MTVWFLVVLAFWGLVLGALARLAVPGPDPMPWWATILLGIAGAYLGGVLAQLFLGTAGGFVFAFLGTVLLLVAYRKLVQKRPLTGPGARELPR